MGQIVGINSDIFRCNLSAIQTGGSKANVVLAADEVWLISTTNSLTNSGSGDCDAYIIGDGTTAATGLELKTDGIKELYDEIVVSDKLERTISSVANICTRNPIIAANGYTTYYIPVKNGDAVVIDVNVTTSTSFVWVGVAANIPKQGEAVTQYSVKGGSGTHLNIPMTIESNGYLTLGVENTRLVSLSMSMNNDGTIGRKVYELDKNLNEFNLADSQLDIAHINLAETSVMSGKNIGMSFEIGNITISNNGWTYNVSATRVRIKQGVTLSLKKGDTITLTDYTDARFYLGMKNSAGAYSYKGWVTSGGYTLTQNAECIVLLCNKTEKTIANIHDLLDLLLVERTEASATEYVLSEKSIINLEEQRTNLNVQSSGIVSANPYSIAYFRVNEGDKFRLFCRLYANPYKGLNYGFTTEKPASGVAVTGFATKYILTNGGEFVDLTAPLTGYFCVSWYNYATNLSLTAIALNAIQMELQDRFVQLAEAYPAPTAEKLYHHLFINEIFNWSHVTIPCQSLFDIRLAKKLGFSMIEFNVLSTSDGVKVCRHGTTGSTISGMLNSNNEVVSVDVANTTFAELRSNYRYNSVKPQYRVPITSLEEALAECQKLGLIPFVTNGNDSKVQEIFNARYVNYGASNRESLGTYVTIYNYDTTRNTIADIVSKCASIGAPYVHGMDENVLSTLGDANITELIKEVHSLGCKTAIAGCYLTEAQTQHYMDLGIDINASGWNVPLFNTGNVCDMVGNNIIGFDGFTINGNYSIDTDGTIILQTGASISVAKELVFIGRELLDVVFDGEISVTMGRHITNSAYTSSIPTEKTFTTIVDDMAIGFTIAASAETHIYNIHFIGDNVE